MKTGYQSQSYIDAYRLAGQDIRSLDIGEHVVVRPIEGTDHYDLTNVYPFFCHGYSNDAAIQLLHQLALAKLSPVSITLIGDPFNPPLFSHWLYKSPRDAYLHYGEPVTDFKSQCVRDYKVHSIRDLDTYVIEALPENHRRNIRSAVKAGLAVHSIASPADLAENVFEVYQNLVERHKIEGQTNYTLEQFKLLLGAPGALLFEVTSGSEVLNYSLFYRSGDKVYYHLSCQTEIGYALKSNFLMMHYAFKCFRTWGFEAVEIGGTPDGSESSGLSRFKSGFANRSVTNKIYNIILEPQIYKELSKGKTGDFLPKYRRLT